MWATQKPSNCKCAKTRAILHDTVETPAVEIAVRVSRASERFIAVTSISTSVLGVSMPVSAASGGQEEPQGHETQHLHDPIHALFPDALQHHHEPQTERLKLLVAARKVMDSTGSGFVYGTLFGSVLAAIEGVRESPKQQRLRGVLHHSRVMVPETAGKIATVTCLFRVVSLGLEEARGKRDMYNTLLAAPIAGGLLRIRRGPQAALHSAAMFGSFGAVVLLFSKVESKVVHHKASPEEMLEEIAFAEEMDE